MAREYTRVKLTIWNDPDFRQLPADAQWLYFALMTHPSISLCGVVDWREARLTAISADMNVTRLRAAALALGQGRFIAVDPETEEALVRSFVRHDGVLQSPNMARSMVRQHAEIASLKLMELVSVEVRRATVENPEWKGLASAEPVWKQFPESDGKGFEMVPETLWGTLPETLSGTLSNQFDFSSPIPEPITLTSKDVSTLPPSQAKRADRTNRFEEFWEAYPRKDDKKKAHTIYDRIAKTIPEQTIIDGARRYAADPNRDPAYTKYPTTWLNAGAWDNQPLPSRASSNHESQAMRNARSIQERFHQPNTTTEPWEIGQ